MKNVKDTLIKESETVIAPYEKYIDIDNIMFSMVIVSNGEKTQGCVFKDLKQIQTISHCRAVACNGSIVQCIVAMYSKKISIKSFFKKNGK